MTSITNNCEHVFRSVESVRNNHFIMDWKNALTHFETIADIVETRPRSRTNVIFDGNDTDTDEEEDLDAKLELHPSTEPEDFCIFQFEL